MQLAWALVLLAAAGMATPDHHKSGCSVWEINHRNSEEVCCEQCHPGSFLLTKCGKDPKELCQPCHDGTFSTVLGQDNCTRCTQCKEFQQEEKQCTSSQDRVCVCMKGYRCSDPQCSTCELQCSQGQELVGGSCQPCPPGTFQNGTQRKCIPWKKECPHSDPHVVIEGTATRDIVCGPLSPAHFGWMVATLSISPILFVLTVVACVLGSRMRTKKLYKQQLPEKHGPDPTRADRRAVQENCCFPQQEQGSDLSLNSEDSEKLAGYPSLLRAEII